MRNLPLILLLACVLAGCQSKAKNRHDGLERIYTPDGKLIYESKSVGFAYAESVANPQGETKVSAGHRGTESTAAGAWKADPIDWAAKNTGWLYIFGAVALIGGGLLATLGKQRIPGAAVSAAGGVLITAPSVIDQLGLLLLVATGLLAAGGLAWLAITAWKKQEAKKRAPEAAKEMKAALATGDIAKMRSATALARTVSPELDKGFEAIK